MIATAHYPILTFAKLLKLHRISKKNTLFLFHHHALYHLWNIKNTFFPVCCAFCLIKKTFVSFFL